MGGPKWEHDRLNANECSITWNLILESSHVATNINHYFLSLMKAIPYCALYRGCRDLPFTPQCNVYEPRCNRVVLLHKAWGDGHLSLEWYCTVQYPRPPGLASRFLPFPDAYLHVSISSSLVTCG